jgi:SAM-dependent methyltransferase
MLELFANELAAADQRLAEDPRLELSAAMRRIPLEVFGELCLAVPDNLNAIRSRLPTMASDEVQRNWTGNCGQALMSQSVAFVRTMLSMHGNRGDREMDALRILDFGCGWGRLLRLLLKYVPAERLHGVDPWHRSIDLCREHGIPCRLALSDYIPRSLPFEGPFDLVYAFSVFTHLSEPTARAALATIRRSISERGMLCLTIRPIEYWNHHGSNGEPGCIERHRDLGFVFLPHESRKPIEGEITYGDTSMSLDQLATLAEGWTIAEVEWNPCDPLQVVVALVPS